MDDNDAIERLEIDLEVAHIGEILERHAFWVRMRMRYRQRRIWALA